ncbi:Rv3235 family protein [Arthrobacter sp. zg-Y826]|uniref:Rv3235 family protein n=1 Tax=Arthrobacter jinronghuae TaxID=2964609 RepID=UPI002102DA17|nr:Rv3235 family protein [Arthrobacter jinronghuae]MCQ1955080.1 Rv3235 family protein [Arthrobacter jinronghuae]
MTSVIFLPAPDAPAGPAQRGQSGPDGDAGPIAVYLAPSQELLPAPVPAKPRERYGVRGETGPLARPAAGAANWTSNPADDARVKAICQSVALAALEVLGGVRPLQQMARWLDPENYERLQLRTNLVRGLQRNPQGRSRTAPDPQLLHRSIRIRSCRLCPVSEGIYEATVVALEHERARAVALRVQLRRGLWKVTALEIG